MCYFSYKHCSIYYTDSACLLAIITVCVVGWCMTTYRHNDSAYSYKDIQIGLCIMAAAKYGEYLDKHMYTNTVTRPVNLYRHLKMEKHQ